MNRKEDPHADYLDVLRLSERDIDQVLSDLDIQSHAHDGVRQRTHERMPFRASESPGILLEIDQPGGTRGRYRVVPRNLSAGGLGFLHGSFIYSGVRGRVRLTKLNGQVLLIAGTVVRCEHVHRNVHEVGMRFDREIDLRDFISDLRTNSVQADDFDVPRLEGEILYVDDCVDDRELMRFFSERLGVKMTTTDNSYEAIELAIALNFDLVLSSTLITVEKHDSLASVLRERGFSGPIIAVTPDEGENAIDEALKTGSDQVVIKPYRFEELVAVMREYLPSAEEETDALEAGPLPSLRWYNVRMRPVILKFLERLRDRLKDLKGLLADGELGTLRKALSELKGSAGGYGYPQISDAAAYLIRLSHDDHSARELQAASAELMQLCERACLVYQKIHLDQ